MKPSLSKKKMQPSIQQTKNTKIITKNIKIIDNSILKDII